MLVNGKGYSFATIELGLLGNSLVAGFKAIEYRSTRAKNNIHGAGGEPVERTVGQKNYTGSISITAKEAIRIREAAGKRSLVDIPPFPITVTFANGEDAAITDIITYVDFTEDPVSSSDGDTEITVVLPFIAGGVLYNQ